MRLKIAKMRPKIAKMRLKIAKMRPKIAKIRLKMAKMILYEKSFKKEAIVSHSGPSECVCMHAFWSFSGSF